MPSTVRLETPADVAAIYRVNEAAFGRPNEANLVNALRTAADPVLSLVATVQDQVVGHLFFSPVAIVPAREPAPKVLGLAPLAVMPDHQRRGVGSQLVQQGLAECRRLGFDAIVVLGDPCYYQRFGFVPAKQYGLTCEYSVPDDAFQAVELSQGSLQSCRGVVKYRPEFALCE